MLLPVMVYIFGGGFSNNAANRSLYRPDYFMQKDVVVVTLNYRLDSLGKQNYKAFRNIQKKCWVRYKPEDMNTTIFEKQKHILQNF